MTNNKHVIHIVFHLDEWDERLGWVWSGWSGAAPLAAVPPGEEVALSQLLHLRHHEDGGGYRHQEQQVCTGATADKYRTQGTVDIYLKGTRCLFTGNSQCSQGTNRSEYRKLYARIVYREPCVHKMMPVYSHCTAGPYRSTGNQCCESGMNYSGSGYDFLRVPFLDPGKCPDPTGSGFTTARMDKWKRIPKDYPVCITIVICTSSTSLIKKTKKKLRACIPGRYQYKVQQVWKQEQEKNSQITVRSIMSIHRDYNTGG